MNLPETISNVRKAIEDSYYEFDDAQSASYFDRIDDFLKDESVSDLEKAFYLILNQFPGNMNHYIVHPREMVLVPDMYSLSTPGIEYELDFAIYGGTFDNPCKIAIECDGIRSHGEKQKNKDRRKDVNLQLAGWVVMRFSSKEIHEELSKMESDDAYTCEWLTYVENVVGEKAKPIDHSTYIFTKLRNKLTGYRWGWVQCTHCGDSQKDILNHKSHVCRHCGKKFKRVLKPEDGVVGEHNGLLIFDE